MIQFPILPFILFGVNIISKKFHQPFRHKMHIIFAKQISLKLFWFGSVWEFCCFWRGIPYSVHYISGHWFVPILIWYIFMIGKRILTSSNYIKDSCNTVSKIVWIHFKGSGSHMKWVKLWSPQVWSFLKPWV